MNEWQGCVWGRAAGRSRTWEESQDAGVWEETELEAGEKPETHTHDVRTRRGMEAAWTLRRCLPANGNDGH